MERQTTPDDLYWAAVLGCYEMLRNGITTTADRFSHMSVQAEGIAATGIRAVLGATLTDARRTEQQADALALLERWGTAPESRIRAALAPHATETCGPDLLPLDSPDGRRAQRPDLHPRCADAGRGR